MKQNEPFHALKNLVDTVRVGLMSTVGPNGFPRSRWMTAAMLPGERDRLYCFSVPDSGKVADIQADEKVSWSFQAPSLDEVVSASGRAVVLDNPELKARLLEALGRDLETFWRVHPDQKRLVVIETAVESVRLFRPMENFRANEEART